ncbi:non-ribosomal peptide synthetase, partial [Flavobacterium notoginsengisoli]|uniref:non-ribosomal peptide synthetase n=1 Tax=Flavobacterium notoginsengisoli TaxID=1478199 RepID=UPI00363E7DEC
VPLLWVELDSMPLTSNGKLDRKGLPDPDSSELSSREYVSPGNETEEKLAIIWQDLLGLDQVGIYDNFFEIGGDSIISIRLISKINETFHQRIQLKDLFKYGNIHSFSASVLDKSGYDPKLEQSYEKVESDISTLRLSVMNSLTDLDSLEDVYPMTDVQQGMIMESLLKPGLAVFHDQMVFPFKDQFFDNVVFHKAITLLIEKHSIFRTRFNISDYDQPVQIVYRTVSFDIGQTDLSLFSKEVQKKRIEEFLASEREIPFKVEEGSLYRFNIFNIDSFNKIFVYQFHHAIMDGWSVASFVTELHKTYFELKKQNDYLPSVITCSQRDFVIKELVAKQDVDAIDFWKRELSSYKYLDVFLEETEVSYYYSKKYDLSFLGNLRKQCKEYNITLKTVFFGAYIYALHMLTREDELTIGLVSNNRPLIKDGDKVLGCFLNTLPVRYIFQSDESWLSYFKSIEKKIDDVNLYGHLTFFEIKHLVGINNEDSFFDVLFNYIDFHVYDEIATENTLTNNLANENIYKENLNIASFERTSSSLNLTINLTGGAGVEFEYALHKDFKSKVSLERFQSYIDNTLHCFNEKINSTVSMNQILSKVEFNQLTKTFNDTFFSYPKHTTVVDLFSEQVRKNPQAIAVIYENKELSFQDLDKLSNQLARYLLSTYDIHSEGLIGVVLDRSDWLIVSFLAILKTGAAYVPIDINYPEKRKEYIRSDINSRIIIDDLLLNSFQANSSNFSDDLLEVTINDNDLAYVIYTSGSTGKPKGVMIEHKSIVNTILSQISSFSINNNDNCLQFASSSFDASIWEICISLFSGSCLYIIEEESKSDTGFFKNFIISNSITFATLPPAFLQLLEVEDLKGIRTLVTAGESIALRIAKTFSKHCNYINAYGPTETSICATTFNGNIGDLVPIGKPIHNTQIYILNEYHDLLPVGVIGELCIGGVGVARGYLNQESLTAEKFVNNPFRDGERLYKTGDLARWLPDGNLEYIGRSDAQVKIRGYRIELGEIENALSLMDQVKQC